MANTFVDVICPSIGAAWAAAVAKWAEAIQDPNNTITYDLTSIYGLQAMTIRVQVGADFTYYRYGCAEIESTATKVPMAYVLGCPGWRAVPPVLMNVYGAVDTKNSWENVLYLLKNQIVTNWCGATLELAPVADHTYGDLTNVHVWTATYRWRAAKQVGVDAMSLTTKTAAVTATWLGNLQATDGMQSGSPTVIGGGGSTSIDLEPLTEAVLDLSALDVTYTANNGRSIFSMRGRVGAGP